MPSSAMLTKPNRLTLPHAAVVRALERLQEEQQGAGTVPGIQYPSDKAKDSSFQVVLEAKHGRSDSVGDLHPASAGAQPSARTAVSSSSSQAFRKPSEVHVAFAALMLQNRTAEAFQLLSQQGAWTHELVSLAIPFGASSIHCPPLIDEQDATSSSSANAAAARDGALESSRSAETPPSADTRSGAESAGWKGLFSSVAIDLEHSQQLHLSAAYLLATRDVYGAIDVYRRQGRVQEALALADMQLIPEDQVTVQLRQEYAQELQVTSLPFLMCDCCATGASAAGLPAAALRMPREGRMIYIQGDSIYNKALTQ